MRRAERIDFWCYPQGPNPRRAPDRLRGGLDPPSCSGRHATGKRSAIAEKAGA